MAYPCSGVGTSPKCLSGKFFPVEFRNGSQHRNVAVLFDIFPKNIFMPGARHPVQDHSFMATSGSNFKHPNTAAAMVRVDFVQSMQSTTGALRSLANSAVLVLPWISIPSYSPRFPSTTEIPSFVEWDKNE